MEFGRNRKGGAKGWGAKPSAPPHAQKKFHQSFINVSLCLWSRSLPVLKTH